MHHPHQTSNMKEFFRTLPRYKCSWSKGRLIMYYYQGFWNVREYHQGAITAQQRFINARPSNILICSFPKTGTTWLKALAFTISTRTTFDESSTPLLTKLPHDCIPFLEKHHDQIQDNATVPLVATHLPYTSLPESYRDSNCKIVYIYRNVKDVIVSYYHYMREMVNLPMEDAPFEEAVDEFAKGISYYGPYWDHILGYLKAYTETPETMLFLKYEDLKTNPACNVKKLAEFMGYPFSKEEIEGGVVEKIVKLCSFEKLRNLEVNQSGKHYLTESIAVENSVYFRKAEDGDWKNYFTEEMKDKIDKLVDHKMRGTGLTLK